MNEKKDATQMNNLQKIASSPLVKGSVLGAGVMTLVTPGINWTNHRIKGVKMPWHSAMTGAFEYATSAIPSYAVAFGIKALFKPKPNEKGATAYEFASSFTAGAVSGWVCAPFEAVAQNKQLTKNPSTKAVIQQIIFNQGYSGLFRGALSMMGRDGAWSCVFMSASPALKKHFIASGMDKNKAEVLSVAATAGTFGFMTTPVNQLRFRKQLGLTEASANKSYFAHAQDIWQQNTGATSKQRLGFFFKGAVPRTITTTAAGGLLVKGQELYDNMFTKP